jgi:hypothetical protein
MGRVCSTNGKKKKNTYRILVRKMEGKEMNRKKKM